LQVRGDDKVLKPYRDVMLGYTDADFRAMGESLVRNLPLGKPPTTRPPTAPRRVEEAAEGGE
jgi:hypothetical protein